MDAKFENISKSNQSKRTNKIIIIIRQTNPKMFRFIETLNFAAHFAVSMLYTLHSVHWLQKPKPKTKTDKSKPWNFWYFILFNAQFSHSPKRKRKERSKAESNRIRICKIYNNISIYYESLPKLFITPNLIYSRPLDCLLPSPLSSNRQQNHNFRICIVLFIILIWFIEQIILHSHKWTWIMWWSTNEQATFELMMRNNRK